MTPSPESPLVVAMRRLETIRDHQPCWFGERRQPPCEKGDAAFCDQCGIRWDVEAALDALAKLATRDTQIQKLAELIRAYEYSIALDGTDTANVLNARKILALLDAKDGACQHCDGSGCEACDARHVPAKDGAS